MTKLKWTALSLIAIFSLSFPPVLQAQELRGDLGEVRIKIDFKQDVGINEAILRSEVTLGEVQFQFVVEETKGKTEAEVLSEIKEGLERQHGFTEGASAAIDGLEIVISPKAETEIKRVAVDTGDIQQIAVAVESKKPASTGVIELKQVKDEGGFQGDTTIRLTNEPLTVFSLAGENLEGIATGIMELLEVKLGPDHVTREGAKITISRISRRTGKEDSAPVFNKLDFNTTVPALDPLLVLEASAVSIPTLHWFGFLGLVTLLALIGVGILLRRS